MDLIFSCFAQGSVLNEGQRQESVLLFRLMELENLQRKRNPANAEWTFPNRDE
jgi:hypothetical protein